MGVRLLRPSLRNLPVLTEFAAKDASNSCYRKCLCRRKYMKEGLFLNGVNCDRTGISIYQAVKDPVFIYPYPAAANLVIIKLTFGRTKFTFNFTAHMFIPSFVF